MGIGSAIASGASKAGNNLKENMLGLVEKAIIEVIDLRDREIVHQDAVRVVQGSATDSAVIPDGNGGSRTTYTNAGIVNDAIDAAEGALSDDQKQRVKDNSIVNRFVNAKSKYYTVQFNPNTIRLSGHSGGLVRKTIYQKDTGDPENMGGVVYGPGKTYIDFSVSLFFDKVDPQDAFLADKLAMSPSNVGTGLVKAGTSIAGVKHNTVQPEVEGFIAALRNEKTRLITFHWGDFNYSGVLKNINATYQMFNINGEPIRATVDLTMTCADDDISTRSLRWWEEIYKKNFENGSESLVKAEQYVGNLVNI